jgi:hypothetical protein
VERIEARMEASNVKTLRGCRVAKGRRLLLWRENENEKKRKQRGYFIRKKVVVVKM